MKVCENGLVFIGVVKFLKSKKKKKREEKKKKKKKTFVFKR